MVAINFKAQFAPQVAAFRKTNTIRCMARVGPGVGRDDVAPRNW